MYMGSIKWTLITAILISCSTQLRISTTTPDNLFLIEVKFTSPKHTILSEQWDLANVYIHVTNTPINILTVYIAPESSLLLLPANLHPSL